jgi:hypothetical protein
MPSLTQSQCNSLGLSVEPDAASDEVMIERLVRVGPDVQLELLSSGGERRAVRLSGDEVDELELREGDILFVSRAT